MMIFDKAAEDLRLSIRHLGIRCWKFLVDFVEEIAFFWFNFENFCIGLQEICTSL